MSLALAPIERIDEADGTAEEHAPSQISLYFYTKVDNSGARTIIPQD